MFIPCLREVASHWNKQLMPHNKTNYRMSLINWKKDDLMKQIALNYYNYVERLGGVELIMLSAVRRAKDTWGQHHLQACCLGKCSADSRSRIPVPQCFAMNSSNVPGDGLVRVYGRIGTWYTSACCHSTRNKHGLRAASFWCGRMAILRNI